MTNPCDACPDPGKCCRKFRLFDSMGAERTFDRSPAGVDAAGAWLAGNEIPFEVIGIVGAALADVDPPAEGVAFWYGCPRLTPTGRCGDYDNRPDTCIAFQPASCPLCVLYVEPEKEPSS